MREMKDSGIEWIGEIPAAWQVSKIKYFFDCLDGKRVPVDAGERISGPYPYWGAGSVTDHVNDYLFDEELILLGEDGAPFFDYTRPVAFLVNEKIWVNNHIHVLKPHRSVCPSYLVHYLNNVDYKTYINGSILNKLTQSNMNTIAFVVPPYEEQVRIAAFLDRKCAEIDAVIERTKATIEEYKKLKQSIITEAVTKGIRGDRSMKESGIEWIGEMPTEWSMTKLSGATLSMRNGYVGPTRDLFFEDGVRYIQSLHIKNGKIDFDRHPYYVSDEWAEVHPKIKTNDILIVQTGDIGQVGIVEDKYDGCNCHALIIATPNSDVVIPNYLKFYLMSFVGRELMLSFRTGALLPHLNAGKIKFTPVVVPSLHEQEEIAEYLAKKCAEIDALIDKKMVLLEELEEYKESVIYEYVTGKKEVV